MLLPSARVLTVGCFREGEGPPSESALRAEAPVTTSLHAFITANQEVIIERARRESRRRSHPASTETRMLHGVPLFLGQLVEALKAAGPGSDTHSATAIGEGAAQHGLDLLKNGYSLEQVVHGYGDVCQIVTDLATDTHANIDASEFHVFNRCLDEAIAAAVTSYGKQRELDVAYRGTERMGFFAHELRNLLNIAILSFEMMKQGSVAIGGSTSAMHARSLASLLALVERSLAEVRMEAGVPVMLALAMNEFIEEIALSATMDAEARDIVFRVEGRDVDASIEVDRQLLASALLNLIQNAFKFTKPKGTVVLQVRVADERVLIEVCDECGGLPAGNIDLFRSFTQQSADRSGLGLGLSIALAAVHANGGHLYVRDVPGFGCVFTIDLPRAVSPAASLTPVA